MVSLPPVFHVKHGPASPIDSRLLHYRDLLLEWNKTINLIGPISDDDVWQRHIQDCLQLVPFIPPGGRVIDIGSGGGLPGLVLAIAANAAVELVEADRRKAAFLRHAAAVLGVDCKVHADRADQLRLPPAERVTARAVAPLPRLLPLLAPLLLPGGEAVLLKGRGVQDEIAAARLEWRFSHRIHPSETSPTGTIVVVARLERLHAQAG
jgi:16S rRNA (guanine527-N7)-methyltransferase